MMNKSKGTKSTAYGLTLSQALQNTSPELWPSQVFKKKCRLERGIICHSDTHQQTILLKNIENNDFHEIYPCRRNNSVCISQVIDVSLNENNIREIVDKNHIFSRIGRRDGRTCTILPVYEKDVSIPSQVVSEFRKDGMCIKSLDYHRFLPHWEKLFLQNYLFNLPHEIQILLKEYWENLSLILAIYLPSGEYDIKLDRNGQVFFFNCIGRKEYSSDCLCFENGYESYSKEAVKEIYNFLSCVREKTAKKATICDIPFPIDRLVLKSLSSHEKMSVLARLRGKHHASENLLHKLRAFTKNRYLIGSNNETD